MPITFVNQNTGEETRGLAFKYEGCKGGYIKVLNSGNEPQPNNETISCPSTLPTRLGVGMNAQVTTSGQVPELGIRHDPGKENGSFNLLKSGTSFGILSGPACSDDSYWWYVRTEQGIEGWVRESNEEFYFIDPPP